ncbi:O-antigen ligase family protein [Anabaena azotica]|uniref:O-antigen ligase family protein n=1 Tax=Anabaena azotica TaxID=197653 RepID=UPI0039A48909
MILISKVLNSKKKSNLKQLISQDIIRESKKNLYLPISLLIISIIILFLNGSRASLTSFLIFSLYILYYLFSRLNPIKFIYVSLLSLSLVVLSLTFFSINYDFLLSNRNLELISEGHSSSLEGRSHLYELGIKDIYNNPITGNYVERNYYRDSGTYIHNFLGLIQDFGIPSFLSYLFLIFYSVKCFRSLGRSQDCNSITYNGILIVSIIQVVFFRYPINFYPIFIIFGMNLRS